MDALTQERLVEIRKSELKSMFPDLIGYLNKSLEGFAKKRFAQMQFELDFELGYAEDGSESWYYLYEKSMDESLIIGKEYEWSKNNISWFYNSIGGFICLFYPYLEFEWSSYEFEQPGKKKTIVFKYKVDLHN